MPAASPHLRLRPVADADLEDLFGLESEVEGADLIAFLPREPGDRAGFDAHWSRLRTDPDVVTRIIEADGRFAGYLVSFLVEEARQVGYWVPRSLWGRGIATAALRAFVGELDTRPLWGSTAAANLGSQRVLQSAGFVPDRVERTLAPRHGALIEERVFRLDA